MLKEISYSKLRELLRATPLKELKKVKSFVVTGDGEYAFTIVIPTTDFIKGSVETLGILSNSVCQGGDIDNGNSNS